MRPEQAGGEPADPESYERETLARAEDVLRRNLVTEREELRDVRLEGSYPDTRVVVTLWDARGPRPYERTFSARIWAPPNWVPNHGIYEPPNRAGLDIAIRAMGG
jgi:hypothetical protein